MDLDRPLPHFFQPAESLLEHRIAGAGRPHDLDQWDQMSRIPPMRAEQAGASLLFKLFSDPGDRNDGRIACKNGVARCHTRDLQEQVLLQLQPLRRGLEHDVRTGDGRGEAGLP